MLLWWSTEQTIRLLCVLILLLNILPYSVATVGTNCSDHTNCTKDERCNGTSGVCECAEGYYDDNGTQDGGACLTKVGLGSACPEPDACTGPNAECSAGKICVCSNGFYDSDGTVTTGGNCTAKVGLGSACPQPDACTGPNAECSAGKICVCSNGFYDSDGNITIGGNCTAKVGLGSICPQSDACITSSAICGVSAGGVNNICVCTMDYYDSNGRQINGTCNPTTDLRVSSISYGIITLDTIPISWTAPIIGGVNYYVVEHNPADMNVTGSTQTVNKTSANLYYLVSGRRYSITITSVNTETASSPRSISVIYYQTSKPSIPGNLLQNKDIDASSGSINLQWNMSAGDVTGYLGSLSSDTLFPKYNQNFSTAKTKEQRFTGVKNGTWYNFTVQAVSSYNGTDTLYSDIHTQLIKTKVQVPNPPTMVQCFDIKDTSINLTWIHPLEPNGDIQNYVVQTYLYPNLTGPLMSSNTTSSSESFIITDLDPGQYYRFRVFTKNELYLEDNGAWSPGVYCQTIANMSGPPVSLKEIAKTSRSFTLSWNQPSKVNGELLGYVLVITKGETSECVIKEFTMCSSGCTSAFPNLTVNQPLCSQNTNYTVNQSELYARTRIFTSSLTPDTVYKVSVAAVNQASSGHTAVLDVTTLEEVPQKPYDINVTDIQATNATVKWNIDGPRPGNTTYTIFVTGDSLADLKTFEIPDFSTRSSKITGLEEYWHYSLRVIASTKIGKNESHSFQFNTTVAPAGNVSDFSVRGDSGNDMSVTAIVSWGLPGILQRNGPISSFTVLQETMVNGTFVQMNSRNINISESNLYSTAFQVQREQLHRFVVFAFNGMDGAASSVSYYAPAAEKPSTVGALAGGIAGGVAALILIAVILIVLWRRKSNKLRKARRLSNDGTESNMENLSKIRKKRPINLATFAEYVADYHKDSNLKFSEEYEDLKTLSPQHSHEAADMEENRLKNRFVNILPFDHSRVRLLPIDDVPGSDYINANYLPGFSKTREYIACQGPIPATIDDHWRLIWEQNVRVIVMLTQYKEENRVKCEPYMPLEPKEPKQYGDIVVECLTYSSMNSFEYRTLKIRLGEKERTVKHFHFLSWRDYSANVQFDTMIDFIKKVRSFIQPPDVEGPMIVHCSAGVGRTGTYITIDHMIQHIDKYGADSTVDIFNFVLKMRENRTTMVQTEQQYIFIHDCIKDYLDRFKTYENEAFIHNEDENLYQNTEALEMYQNVNFNSTQKTEL